MSTGKEAQRRIGIVHSGPSGGFSWDVLWGGMPLLETPAPPGGQRLIRYCSSKLVWAQNFLRNLIRISSGHEAQKQNQKYESKQGKV